jgi:hypothetical protein
VARFSATRSVVCALAALGCLLVPAGGASAAIETKELKFDELAPGVRIATQDAISGR